MRHLTTREQVLALVQELRVTYPEPVAAATTVDLDITTYCVGGTLWLHDGTAVLTKYGAYRAFPTSEALMHKLVKFNPALSHDRARVWAMRIICMNDSREFEQAWGHMASALTEGLD